MYRYHCFQFVFNKKLKLLKLHRLLARHHPIHPMNNQLRIAGEFSGAGFPSSLDFFVAFAISMDLEIYKNVERPALYAADLET